MKILGIETSCDEIAAAVLENEKIMSNVIFSSIEEHKKFGGIIPEIAARSAAEKIIPAITEATKIAKQKITDIDAIAVTTGPGLLGSILVGIESARTLALLYQKPLIPVFHIFGHIFSNLLENSLPNFPVAVLTVSGGHTEIWIWEDILTLKKVGETLDDAAGEAFDKVARMLDLPFPGGPEIAKIAKNIDPEKFKFPLPMVNSGDFNFSFSGIKTAVFYKTLELQKKSKKLSKKTRAEIAASFQDSATEILSRKILAAAKKFNCQEIHLAGGVSANILLREKIKTLTEKNSLNFRFPKKIEFCTDNAAMVAMVGLKKFQYFPKKKWNWQKVRPEIF